jgi:hypothetical protein
MQQFIGELCNLCDRKPTQIVARFQSLQEFIIQNSLGQMMLTTETARTQGIHGEIILRNRLRYQKCIEYVCDASHHPKL